MCLVEEGKVWYCSTAVSIGFDICTHFCLSAIHICFACLIFSFLFNGLVLYLKVELSWKVQNCLTLPGRPTLNVQYRYDLFYMWKNQNWNLKSLSKFKGLKFKISISIPNKKRIELENGKFTAVRLWLCSLCWLLQLSQLYEIMILWYDLI